MDQSEGRILYHVTHLTAGVVSGGLGPSQVGSSPARPKHENEATGNDVIKRPEINDRPRGLAKTHFYFQRSGLDSGLGGSSSVV